MLNFVKRAFRGGFEVILWINLILSTIAGGIAGYYLGQLISYRNAGGYAFGGVLIGIICGLLTDIVGGGLIATFLSIEKNAEIQTSILKQTIGKDIPVDKIMEKIDLQKPIEDLSDINNAPSGNTYKVSISTALRSGPSNTANVIKELKNGDIVQLQKISDDPLWYIVLTSDSIKGFCFKHHLDKC